MITFKQFIVEKKEEPPPFFNMHGSHAKPHKKRKKKVTESLQARLPDIHEEMLQHPTNQQNEDNIHPKVERAFKDFSTPADEHTDTAIEHADETGDHEKDFSHLTSRGINNALIHKATGGKHQIPDMAHMDNVQHMEAIGRAHLISKAINKSAPLSREARVYHGTRLDPRDHLDSKGILHSHGFLSTSAHRTIAEDFASHDLSRENKTDAGDKHILSITLPKGHRAMPLSHTHSHTFYESEMLLDKGTKLRHVKSERDGTYNLHHFEVDND